MNEMTYTSASTQDMYITRSKGGRGKAAWQMPKYLVGTRAASSNIHGVTFMCMKMSSVASLIDIKKSGV